MPISRENPLFNAYSRIVLKVELSNILLQSTDTEGI